MFGGEVRFARPLRVVSHTDDVLAAYLAIGTRYFGAIFENRENAYIDFFEGRLPFGEKIWETHNVLILVRPDDPYSVMGFWNEQGSFVGWYVNLQEPARWTKLGYDTQDHALDIIVGEDLRGWMWKDEDELALSVERGLYSSEQGDAIRRAGQEVIDLIDTGKTWWGGWRDFTPDDTWPVGTLPAAWDAI